VLQRRENALPPRTRKPRRGAGSFFRLLATRAYVVIASTENLTSEVDTMSTFSNLLYHVVFSTKGRLPLISEEVKEPLYEYMGGIIRGEGGILLEIGGMPDHVHLLAKFRTDIAVATMVKKIKGKSSKWRNDMRHQAERFKWQEGYGAFSVSESLVKKVRNYIHTQEEHHRRVSFKEELIALLKKHRIPYDERYLLD
jgi:putative transposase